MAAAVQAVLRSKGVTASGCPESFIECAKGSEGCAVHQSCAWGTAKGGIPVWPVK